MEESDRGFTRGASDLVVSLASSGRTVRLFTADGDDRRVEPPPGLDYGSGLLENVSDR
jgi:hypothetical protein